MSKEKPSLPKGTRDFSPEVVGKRNYIFNTIKRTFRKFGFQPLETPTMENLSVLTGKYGDEGDQLIFKILNSGDYLAKTTVADYELGSKHLLRKISEKALRYDLTVPFARYVVMNRNEITFPFKRYQIQPVWRADRPQRGRYREFYQCDADVVGTKSLLCEAEIVLMIDEVFTSLGITDFTIKINHRKILEGIAEIIGQKGREVDFYVAIDKLDKIGVEGVKKELLTKGIPAEEVAKLHTLLSYTDFGIETINAIPEIIKNQFDNQNTQIGHLEIDKVRNYVETINRVALKNVKIDPTLARGLSYYTGCIFEVKVNNVQMGSISGGGRYDNLTGMFGLPNVSGVGISFGVDRIYDVLEELQLFPESVQTSTQVLLTNFDSLSEAYALPILQQLRAAGIATELYPDQVKLAKQMTYADQKKIPYVLLIGSEEITSGQLKFKNMRTGEQESLPLAEIIKRLAL
ncbi:histidine--tRNA ligase [Adhaeribacter pallidiroseus]|uniref:Histidine--tRNA ligase n=1 Tax=Adhaeribacter pallidiroseus TaxID=2072847 RepID=A0A369QL39_9BACT|nr:histidine--tRNA ligase [Adhaeribacter pallidiroseus]RDC62988.1 Histidine--tRNA ligase [Adhaeribacter pallidiroseus]